MSTRVQFRRGTTAQHESFVGANAEITVDTDKKALVVHDGTTPGGFPTGDMQAAANLGDVEDAGIAAQNAAALFASVSAAEGATVKAAFKRIQTQFHSPTYAEPATLMGGATYARVSKTYLDSLTGLPASAWFRSTDRFTPDGSTDATEGGYWLLDVSVCDPAMFGAKRGRENATVTTAALRDAVKFCEITGVSLDLLAGNWFINDSMVVELPITVVGRGKGYWHVKPRSMGDGISSIALTQIILTGTGPKSWEVHGVSSMRPSGGVVSNPSARSGYNDDEYALTSFVTPESDGGQPRSRRMFSAGIWLRPTAAASQLSGFRVIPDGGGDDGMDLYLSTSHDPLQPWAADWDCGIVNEVAPEVVMRDVEAVGHYRMAGELVLAMPAMPGVGRTVPAIWNTAHYNCTFAGAKAVLVRGPDVYSITAVGADYLEVEWADDHPFDPAVFNRVGIGADTFSIDRSAEFTGMTKVGDKLRLTGMSSADLADASVGEALSTRTVGSGTSHCLWDPSCRYSGMHHPSGYKSHDQRLAEPTAHPTGGIEASGWRMTELRFYGSLQSIEEVALHFHAVAASVVEIEGEGSEAEDGVAGLRVITSPSELANSRVAYPEGRTQQCLIDFLGGGVRRATNIDARPMTSTGPTSFNGVGDNGFFEGLNLSCPSAMMEFRGNNGTGSNFRTSGLRTLKGMQAGILHEDGSLAFGYDDTSDVIYTDEHIEPTSDFSKDLGSDTRRFRTLRLENLRLWPGGTGQVPGTNGEMRFAVISDTEIELRYRGSDGTVRAAILALS